MAASPNASDPEPDSDKAAAYAEDLRLFISGEVDRALVEQFGVRSFLELEFEKIYVRFFLPELRGSAEGSKKRYAGLVPNAGGDGEVEIVGLEAVRRDTSAIVRRFQRELFDLVLRDRPPEPFIRAFVAELRAGRFDAELVYRKALRKPGSLAIWSTEPDKAFEKLLTSCGFKVRRYKVKAYKESSTNPLYIWVAAEDESILPAGGDAPELTVAKPAPVEVRKKKKRRSR